MKIYTTKIETSSTRAIVVDDMILTKDMPTSAGSKMLDGYKSLFDAEVVNRLRNSEFVLSGKTDVGEFSIDLVGETSYNGACEANGKLTNACAEVVKSGEALAGVCLDVNGSIRRATAQNDLICVKPTYGTVSRYGTIPVACSGETVSVIAKTVGDCREVLNYIVGHDDKDGTSLSDELCNKLKENANACAIRKVAVLKSMVQGIDKNVKAKLDNFISILAKNNIEVCEIDDSVICTSRVAWNILMSAELCNNVSRYDGVKFGYRTTNYTNIDELYTNSRTEAFGDLLKTAILFGSDTLSTDNYMKVYDKALRTRRVIVESFAKIFKEYDAIIMPACSNLAYTKEQVEKNKYISFEENFYTAPSSISGLPAVVVGGVQLVGNSFSESILFELAKMYEKEGK